MKVSTGKSSRFMVRGKVLFTALVACVVVAVGCSTDRQTAEKIRRAEAIAMELPDSALRVVQSIDPEAVRGKHDRAHYLLVAAEAHYYNRLAVDRDSIAQPIFDYYIESDNHAERARALYQHALVMQSEGENARAMYSLLEAEKSLSHLDNPRLSGLVHRTKGDIYGTECLFQNALEEYQKSKECFVKAELPFHSAYALYNIANTHGDLRNFKDAIQMLISAENNCIENNFKTLLYDIQIELCYDYIQIDDFDSCLGVISRINANDTEVYSMCDYYCICAIISTYKRNYIESDESLNKARQEPIINPMQLAYSEYLIMKMRGDDSDALISYKAMIAEQDKSVFNIVNNSLLQSQIELLESEQSLIVEKAKSNKITLTSVIITLLLLVVAILLYIRYRSAKQSRDIANYVGIIAELEQSVKSASHSTSNTYLQGEEFSELNKLFELYYQYGDTTQISSKIAKAVSSSIENIKNDNGRLQNFENIINSQYNNILDDIKADCPKLYNNEYRYIIYYLLGFSNRSIAVLLDIDTEALSRLKYRVKVKLSESNNENIKSILNKRRIKSAEQ